METCPLHPLLQQDITCIKESQARVEQALTSNGKNVGLAEQVRNLQTDMTTLKEDKVARLENDLVAIKDKSSFWRDKRLVLLVAVLSALTGSIASWIFGFIK